MRLFSARSAQLLLAIALSLICFGSLRGQETETESAEAEPVTVLDDEGRLVRFERDIAPILRSRCLECHGPEEAKADFRVDDVDTMMSYVEPEDVEGSMMFADFLVTDDEDTLMPPTSHGGPLSPGELALIRVWIEEGAVWPEGFELVAETQDDSEEAAAPEPEKLAPKTMGERIWVFQGYLHPATVHFPIAFFLLGAGFVVLGWKWPSVGTQIPLACLLLGALSAIAASAMGWAFAPEQGYGSGWSLFDWEREINVHRMSGAIVAVLAAIVALIALVALWKDSESMTKYWKIGLLALAAMVGLVGHQGGELSYGTDFYPKAFAILFGTDGEQAETETDDVDTDDADTSDATSESGDESQSGDQPERDDDAEQAETSEPTEESS